MKNWALRTKLAVSSALLTAAVLGTFCAVLGVGFYFRQMDTIHTSLAANAEMFMHELTEDKHVSEEEMDEALLMLKAASPLYGFAFGEKDGPAVLSYPDGIEKAITRWPPAPGYSRVKVGKRTMVMGSFLENGHALVLFADLRPTREMIQDLFEGYLITLPIVLLVGAVGTWWFSRRALRPVGDIVRAAGAITADRLDARLPQPPADDEIGRLTQVLNAMFDRLQRSFEQANRFTADASHELRTPLTILRGEIEDALHSGNFNTEQESVLLSVLEQTERLQKISETLLLLSRFDAGKAPLHWSTFSLSVLVQDACEDAGMLASSGKLQIEANIQANVQVEGDVSMLRRLLLNLVDNAVRYNRPGGTVKLRLQQNLNEAYLVIANTGPGISDAQRQGLFQRFFRSNADRNRTTGGSGLGLSLCREIAAAHHGTIALTRSETDYTEFTVRLPVAK